MDEMAFYGVYKRSPIIVQNAMLNVFGVMQRRLRHHGDYDRLLAESKRLEWASRDELQADQDRRVRRIIGHAVDRVPYYRDLFAKLNLTAADIQCAADLAQLPVLEKETVRAEPERFCTDGSTKGLVPQTTGGTTGTPLRYYVTPESVQFNYAWYEARFRHWAGVNFGDRMATMNGRVLVPTEQHKPPFWRYNLAFNQLYLSIYHLTPDNLDSYVDALRRFKPEVVVGYPSAVHLVTRHIIDAGRIGEVTPTAVLLSSETLFPWMRADIEQAFGCAVFDGYSQGELTVFITECPHGSMHISPEYGVVELVELDGELEIVATGLSNFGMPLIRYRTRDIAEPGDGSTCECGRQLPTIAGLAGRADDVVVTPDGRSVGPAPLSLAFQSVHGIRESQIRQSDRAAIDVDIVVEPGSGPAIESRLLEELQRRLGTALEINISRVDAIPRTMSGKRQLVVSNMSAEH